MSAKLGQEATEDEELRLRNQEELDRKNQEMLVLQSKIEKLEERLRQGPTITIYDMGTPAPSETPVSRLPSAEAPSETERIQQEQRIAELTAEREQKKLELEQTKSQLAQSRLELQSTKAELEAEEESRIKLEQSRSELEQANAQSKLALEQAAQLQEQLEQTKSELEQTAAELTAELEQAQSELEQIKLKQPLLPSTTDQGKPVSVMTQTNPTPALGAPDTGPRSEAHRLSILRPLSPELHDKPYRSPESHKSTAPSVVTRHIVHNIEQETKKEKQTQAGTLVLCIVLSALILRVMIAAKHKCVPYVQFLPSRIAEPDEGIFYGLYQALTKITSL